MDITIPHNDSHIPDVSTKPLVLPARQAVVTAVSILALVFSVILGIEQMRLGNISLASADIALAVSMALNLAILLVLKTVRLCAGILVAATAPFLFYLLVTGGVEATGYMWSLAFPVSVFFLLGSRIGLYVSFVYLLCAVCFFFLPESMPYAAHYRFAVKVRFIGVYSLGFIVGFFYDYVQVRALRNLHTENMRRRIIEQRLIESRDRADSLYHLMPCAVFTLDGRNIITSFNKRAEELTGYRARDVVLSPCALWEREGPVLTLANTHGAPPMQYRRCTIRRKDGTMLTVLRTSSPLTDGHGNTTGSIECFLDAVEIANAQVA